MVELGKTVLLIIGVLGVTLFYSPGQNHIQLFGAWLLVVFFGICAFKLFVDVVTHVVLVCLGLPTTKGNGHG